jgi:hypothetical protein
VFNRQTSKAVWPLLAKFCQCKGNTAMKIKSLYTSLTTAGLLMAGASGVQAVPLTLDALTGFTGGSPAQTGVFRADLSSAGIGNILSITIQDSNSGIGGSNGEFSGFDLDAIILSNTYCESAACAAGLTGLGVFDYSPSGTLFNPGSQRPPTDPALFGTGAGGTEVDDLIATLGLFDGDSSTVSPDGFLSMGDGGSLSLNLTSAVATSGMYLYFGEVGSNGEVAGGQITISDRPVTDVPEPSTLGLLLAGLSGLLYRRRHR